MSSLLFVYGTLTPGRAPACVADLVDRFGPAELAAVRGTVYELGDYPGLVLVGSPDGASPPEPRTASAATGVVVGRLCDVPDDPALWRRLDAYEGYDPAAPATSLFRRVPAVAVTAAGVRVACQTYVYNRRPDPARTVPGGDWLAGRGSAGAAAAAPPLAPTPTERLMRRPIIGITADYVDEKPERYMLPGDYTKTIERAGGLPVILPFRTDLALIPEIVDALDGVLFSGGNDLDPALFGEARHPNAVPVEPARQRFELALLAEVDRRRTPALGVCLGCQLMNVHRGGSLVQFLPDVPRDGALEHRFQGDSAFRHLVRLEPGTVLADAVGGGRDTISVNSRHKQAVSRVGRGLRANAYSPDGLVEGIEDPDMPLYLAVQWHPENLSTAPEHLAPFRRLVEVAGRERAARA